MERRQVKVTITGFNPFGIIETEEHDANEESPVVTGLQPLLIVIEDSEKITPIRFDYEDTPDDPTS